MALNIIWAFENEPPPLDFVIPGFLAGTVGCLAAAGATGKSFWALEAALSVCSAKADECLLRLGVQHHGRVVILNAEDPEIVLHQRLHAIGKHLPQDAREEVAERLTVEALTGTLPDIMNPRWQDAILHAADGARLAIFDTLTRWHRLDENSNGQMSQVVSTMEMIAKRTGASILFLHHVSKGMAREGRQDEQQASRGAAAITDNCRWQGWMQTMSLDAAQEYGVDDRRRYVAVGGNKENYGQATVEQWLERKAGGVLLPVDLHKPERHKPESKNQKKGGGYGE
jgi:regulatory protein RepA